jgi:drug/metabolite transporter (DMT)-like permease
MRTLNTASLTTLAMMAFAGNSLLCRLALRNTTIDAASFTLIRLLSAAVMLLLIISTAEQPKRSEGNWLSAFLLFAYAAGFSFAYTHLTTATGALLLFGAVQISMIGFGLWSGDKFRTLQWLGLAIALGGLLALLLPGVTAPPLTSALLMIAAGMSWGIYSLRGRGAGNATFVTAGNFLRALPFGLGLSLVNFSDMRLDPTGISYAVASGAIASGVGYAIWYRVLPALRASRAAIVQLSVPVIAAIGGALLLGEPLTGRLMLASMAVLFGIALVIIERNRVASA